MFWNVKAIKNTPILYTGSSSDLNESTAKLWILKDKYEEAQQQLKQSTKLQNSKTQRGATIEAWHKLQNTISLNSVLGRSYSNYVSESGVAYEYFTVNNRELFIIQFIALLMML